MYTGSTFFFAALAVTFSVFLNRTAAVDRHSFKTCSQSGFCKYVYQYLIEIFSMCHKDFLIISNKDVTVIISPSSQSL